MHEDRAAIDLIDDPVWFVVDLPECHYADAVQLGWSVASFGKVREGAAALEQVVEELIGLTGGVVVKSVPMDVDQIILRVDDEPNAERHCRPVRARMSLAARDSDLVCPSSMCRLLTARSLSMANDSCVSS